MSERGAWSLNNCLWDIPHVGGPSNSLTGTAFVQQLLSYSYRELFELGFLLIEQNDLLNDRICI